MAVIFAVPTLLITMLSPLIVATAGLSLVKVKVPWLAVVGKGIEKFASPICFDGMLKFERTSFDGCGGGGLVGVGSFFLEPQEAIIKQVKIRGIVVFRNIDNDLSLPKVLFFDKK